VPQAGAVGETRMSIVILPGMKPMRIILAVLPVLAACGGAAGSPGASGGSARVVVVAAENFWGSIAAQLGGARAQVVSIVSNPDTDPHSYESTPADARAVAQAQYVIVNGAGYDPWAPKLLAASPTRGRSVLTVADLAGRREGDNPHMWYSPSIVLQVVDRITADLERIDPADAPYFDGRRRGFLSTSLATYNRLRAEIRQKYTGVPVGATESIFVDLAADLGLDLATPSDYMRAISEGNDPSAQDKSIVDSQVAERRIKVLVFNSQNATTDVQALVDRARGLGIPVVSVTETLSPATATFQDWQSGQLQRLAAALAQASGR
jgi:zinc/manganese transport system substrate-binding protein